MTADHTRRCRLPHGYVVHFSYAHPDALVVAWSPEPPRFRKRRAQARFLEAYWRARDSFLGDVATMRGGSGIAVIDDMGDGLARLAVIGPRTKH